MKMTGDQIVAVLEQQWQPNNITRIMKASGIVYGWDASKPIGSRIVPGSVNIGGVPLVGSQTYTVTCNNFMATGGDGFTVFTSGQNQTGGAVDLDALIAFVKTLPQPFTYGIEGRITRVN
jgi:5'-nucleotidase